MEVLYMTIQAVKLADRVLSLPSEDRVFLVDKLLESLNSPNSEEFDRLWADEVEHRIDELDSGEVKAIPGEQVFAEIRNRLGK